MEIFGVETLEFGRKFLSWNSDQGTRDSIRTAGLGVRLQESKIWIHSRMLFYPRGTEEQLLPRYIFVLIGLVLLVAFHLYSIIAEKPGNVTQVRRDKS